MKLIPNLRCALALATLLGGAHLSIGQPSLGIAGARSGAIKMNEGYFTITRLHRADLAGLGFDTSTVDDATMELLARGLEDVYVEHYFFPGLEMLADDLGIKRK